MKLESQVCSPDQGERLKELGITQESIFYHTHSKFGVMPISSIDFSGNPTSAFTVAELGVMLPDENKEHESYHTLCVDGAFGESGRQWFASILAAELQLGFKTEAYARAAMLIYLLENNLTTPAEVNERIKKAI